MTTFYGTDENSNLRIKLFEKSLKKVQQLWIKVVVFDCGSTHPDFGRIIAQHAEIIDIQRGKFNWLGDQTRKMLEYTNNQYPERYVFRTEPEKHGLLTETSLWFLMQKAQVNPDVLYVSPTRNLEKSKLPRPLAITESSVWRQVNVLMDSKNDLSFQKIHDGSVSEWPGSLFWPILITQKWVGVILLSKDPAWWTWFFPRIVAAMEGKSLYVPIEYNYDEQEIKKENADMRKLWKFCKSEIILDTVRSKLKEWRVQEVIDILQSCSCAQQFDLKNNLAFKRLHQFVIMFDELSDAVVSKK